MGGAKHKIFLVGTGSGDPRQLTPEAAGIIASCGVFAGGRRQLALAPAAARQYTIGADMQGLRDFITEGLEHEDVCVLASGDPGCFSILGHLDRDFHGLISVVPGISSVQMLAARLAVSWKDWRLVSFHGRGAGKPAPPKGTTLYFCDSRNTPAVISRLLLEQMADCPAVAAADLGLESERLLESRLNQFVEAEFPANALLLVEPTGGAAEPEMPDAAAPGIPDGLWLRAEGVPMAKSEVRSVLMGKAGPAGRRVIWDVGSGTGTYAIECSLLERRARVYAIDKRAEACEVIGGNARRFGADISVVCGEAPACLDQLPSPDLAIIGGNDGRLGEIFPAVLGALNPGGRLAVTAVLERTRKAAHELFARSGLEGRAATRVAVARGSKTKWEEQNPVIIFIGDKPDKSKPTTNRG